MYVFDRDMLYSPITDKEIFSTLAKKYIPPHSVSIDKDRLSPSSFHFPTFKIKMDTGYSSP